MKKIFLFMVLVALGFASVSCNKDDGAKIEFQALQIVEAEMPDSFSLNGTYEIMVTYVRPDGCTSFEGFDVAPKDSTVREVVAIGSTLIEQQCTQEIAELRESFLFRVIYDQPYLFRFWQGEDANGDPIFLEVEVPVN